MADTGCAPPNEGRTDQSDRTVHVGGHLSGQSSTPPSTEPGKQPTSAQRLPPSATVTPISRKKLSSGAVVGGESSSSKAGTPASTSAAAPTTAHIMDGVTASHKAGLAIPASTPVAAAAATAATPTTAPTNASSAAGTTHPNPTTNLRRSTRQVILSTKKNAVPSSPATASDTPTRQKRAHQATPATDAEITTIYSEGFSIVETARQIRGGQNAVYKALSRAGVPVRNVENITRYEQEAAATLLGEGVSPSAVAHYLGHGTASVPRLCELAAKKPAFVKPVDEKLKDKIRRAASGDMNSDDDDELDGGGKGGGEAVVVVKPSLADLSAMFKLHRGVVRFVLGLAPKEYRLPRDADADAYASNIEVKSEDDDDEDHHHPVASSSASTGKKTGATKVKEKQTAAADEKPVIRPKRKLPHDATATASAANSAAAAATPPTTPCKKKRGRPLAALAPAGMPRTELDRIGYRYAIQHAAVAPAGEIMQFMGAKPGGPPVSISYEKGIEKLGEMVAMIKRGEVPS